MKRETSWRNEPKDSGGKNHSDGKRGGEGHVRGGGVRKADHAHGGGQKKKQPARCPRAIDTPGEPRHGQGRQQRSEGTGETRRSFAHTEEFEAERRAPVIKDRLLKPGLAIEAGRDPVARFVHFTGDPGVARLVRPHQADGA